MQNRQSLQLISCNTELSLRNRMKSTKSTTSGSENYTRPNTIMQSLQGLQKYFKKDKEFQSVQQQVTNIQHHQNTKQRTCQSLSPRQGIMNTSPSMQIDSTTATATKHKQTIFPTLENNSADCTPIPQLFRHQSFFSQTKPPMTSNKKDTRCQSQDVLPLIRSKRNTTNTEHTSEYTADQWKNQYNNLEYSTNQRIFNLEKQLKDLQGDIIKQSDVSQLKSQITEQQQQIKTYQQSIYSMEQQLNKQNQQIMTLTINNEQQSIIIKQKDKEIQQLRLQSTPTQQSLKYEIMEKDYNRIKSQIPYLLSAMNNMSSIFTSLQQSEHNSDISNIPQLDFNNQINEHMDISSVSMVDMIYDLQEINESDSGPETRLAKFQPKQTKQQVESASQQQQLFKKQPSIASLIQKHLSNRDSVRKY